MIIRKVLTGYVVQEFNTETRLFINQFFVASESKWTDNCDKLLNTKNSDDLNLIYGKDGIGEPHLSCDMVQPINHNVKIGDEVQVIPNHHSSVAEEFIGKVVGFKGPLIQVKDQDDDVFDCDPDEIRPGFEA